GSYYSNLINNSQERSSKISRTKARKASRKAKAASSVGDDSDGCLTSSTMDTSVKNLPPMPIITPCPRVGRAPSGAGAAGAAEGATRPSSRASSAVPGTPGEDEEPQYRNFLDGIDTTRPESSDHDLVESVTTTQLVEELLWFIDNREYAESLSSQTIKEMLEVYNKDRSRTIQAPAAAQTEASGGNHLDHMEVRDNGSGGTKRPGSAARSNPKRQKVTIEEVRDVDAYHPQDPFTDTDAETNTDTESEPEPEPEPKTKKNPAPTIDRVAAESPSPLPRSHRPIDSSVRDSLDLSPFGVSSARPLTRKATSATEIVTPETPPPPAQLSQTLTKSATTNPTATELAGSTPAKKYGKAKRHRRPVRVPAPLKSTARPPPRPASPTSTSALSRASSSRVEVTRKRSKESQRKKQAAQASTSAPAPPPTEPSPAEKEKLEFIHEAGKIARMVREQYRRQALARAAGIRLPEVDPGPSECDPLESDLVHDDKEALVTEAAEASGQALAGRKRKPSARNIFGYEREILLAAKVRFLAHTLKEGALQTRGTFAEWSIKCWLEAMEQVAPHLDPHPPSPAIQQIMINSLVSGRGRFKEPVRSLVQYKLRFYKPPMSVEEVNHNLEVFSSAHPNAFHCLRRDPVYGHYEGALLTQAIAATLLANPNSPGASHCEMFNPVPLTAVAYILALIQFCLEEWETGHFVPRDWSMTDMLNKYVAHLRGLKEARAAAKGRMKRLQQHWFDFGYEYSGAVRPEDPYRQPITLRTDVRPDTPEEYEDEYEESMPDDAEAEAKESEPEMNEEGRYTAAAKGKGRA
ncbi:hypothetical protein FRC07_009756, partial [Ceratobasidium sp. 392]